MATTIYGASDDLIEVDGDITEEFDATWQHPYYLGFCRSRLRHRSSRTRCEPCPSPLWGGCARRRSHRTPPRTPAPAQPTRRSLR